MTNIKASVIVPTYNRENQLISTIKDLLYQTNQNFEIIIVDQSDEVNDDIAKLRAKYKSKLKYFHTNIKGLPHARNYGAAKAVGNVLIFCDDDVVVPPGFVDKHLANYLEGDVGGVAGRVTIMGPEPSGLGLDEARGVGKIRKWDGNQTDNFDSKLRCEVEHAQGCNMSFRRNIVTGIGGFDERFGGSAYLEETDFCVRAKRTGNKIVFDPEAQLIHLKDEQGGCRPRNQKDWFYWYAHNFMLYFMKNFNPIFLPVFLIVRLGRMVLSALTEMDTSIVFAGVRGLFEGFMEFINTGSRVVKEVKTVEKLAFNK